MKTNFFETECQEDARTNAEFGICDDENGEKAYTTKEESNSWIATVKNDLQKNIVFTAIDNCIEILKEGTNDQERTCDGMLTFDNHLYLIELKNQMTGSWKSDAFNQLENTIKLIIQNLMYLNIKRLLPVIKNENILDLKQ